MTETSCVISFMDVGDKVVGHVGSPNPSIGKKFMKIIKKCYLVGYFIPVFIIFF
jgi:long-chain acyl-CoA synthetase